MSGDSDSDCEMVKTDSFSGHRVAPEDRDYPIKIKPLEMKKFGLLYTLKKGQSLPYAPELNGTKEFFSLCRMWKYLYSLLFSLHISLC